MNNQSILSAVHKCIITQNAAPSDITNYPNLNPSNIVTVYGTPGIPLIASVSGNVYFLDDHGTKGSSSIPFSCDEDGEASFRIQAPLSSMIEMNFDLSASLTISSLDGSSPILTYPLIFLGYMESTLAIEFIAYNYTTGAPGDNKTPCSIYLLVDRERNGVDHVTITVDVPVQIVGRKTTCVGKKNYADIPLLSDGSATIDLVCAKKNTYHVQLTATSDGDNVDFDISFLDI